MSETDVNKNIIRNTRSNYILIVVRMLLGLVTFRLLYTGLPQEEFGFWAFLWGVFGTSVLLDFGFGLTVQKQVAQLSVKKRWDELSQVLTTLLTLYLGLAVVIILGGWIASPTIVQHLGISVENQTPFASVLFCFICGMGLSFPLGIFPEILHGQQKISTQNNLVIAGNVASFILVVTALQFGYSLRTIVIFAMAAILVPNLCAGVLGLRSLPEVTIAWRHFTPKLIGETLRFSASAYLILISYMVLTKTDQLVIGTVATMSAVALYQPAAKIGEIFGFLTRQLANTLQPAAAHLHAKGDTEAIKQLLINGTRYSVMLAAPLYVMTASLMAPILEILTGDGDLSQDAMWSAQILVFWAFTFIITHNVYKRVAVMCGEERRLVWVGVGEAIMNLTLSITLLSMFQQVFWVAAATLVSSLFVGWVFLWPWAAKVAGLSPLALAQKTLGRNFLGTLPVLVTIVGLQLIPGMNPNDSFLVFLLIACVSGVAALWGVWRFSLTDGDRAFVSDKLVSLRTRFKRS